MYIDYLNLPYSLGTQDCYTLVQQFYKNEYSLQLKNYARPNAWSLNPQLNLLHNLFNQEGFFDTGNNPNKVQKGDVLVMNLLKSPVDNHIGIYVGRNKILHHMYGKPSELSEYDHRWRLRVTTVLRHPAVDGLSSIDGIVDVLDKRSPQMRFRRK
jgi:cell wall-associated NlpC family hydrolase